MSWLDELNRRRDAGEPAGPATARGGVKPGAKPA